MNNSLKSIGYAFVCRDIDIYIPDGEDDCAVANRLVCSSCGEYWHTSLNECYFCGELNYYLYRCTACGKKYSITNSSIKCTCGEKDSKLIKACVNDHCPSNTDPEIEEKTISEGGVFALNSSFSISQTYCTHCGRTENEYKAYRIYVWDYPIVKEQSTLKEFIKYHPNIKKGDIVIGKHHGAHIKYGYLVYDPEDQSSEIPYSYASINEIINLLYPVR